MKFRFNSSHPYFRRQRNIGSPFHGSRRVQTTAVAWRPRITDHTTGNQFGRFVPYEVNEQWSYIYGHAKRFRGWQILVRHGVVSQPSGPTWPSIGIRPIHTCWCDRIPCDRGAIVSINVKPGTNRNPTDNGKPSASIQWRKKTTAAPMGKWIAWPASRIYQFNTPGNVIPCIV